MIGASPVAMPAQPANLLPVMKSRTLKASDKGMVEKMRLDVDGWGVNEIRKFMLAITVGEMQQQMALDNPPAFSNVDGVRGRGIAFAQRRLTVSFGTRLKREALNALTTGLSLAISKATTRRTGALANMGNWEWRYVRNGKRQPLPLAGASGIPMGPNDFLILMPKNVPYATAVNMRVAGSGKLSFKRRAKGRVTKANQSIGFLALAARSAQASAAFDGFTVTAGFTAKHAVRGEVVGQHRSKSGTSPVRTGFIKIRAKTGSARNR
jgi:hypothetical protein